MLLDGVSEYIGRLLAEGEEERGELTPDEPLRDGLRDGDTVGELIHDDMYFDDAVGDDLLADADITDGANRDNEYGFDCVVDDDGLLRVNNIDATGATTLLEP